MSDPLQNGQTARGKEDKAVFSLNDLMSAASAQARGEGYPPVERWAPDYCGEMDLIIRADGSWWHEGTLIAREKLVKLFATILRKDEDGHTYLVTPYEKIKISVQRAAFTAVRLDVSGQGKEQALFLTTNLGDVIEMSAKRPLRVETDPETLEPSPFIAVRGRLEALLTRPVFYELVDFATERETPRGLELGVWSKGTWFALGPPQGHAPSGARGR